MENAFMAMIFRMKFICRWSLMYNTQIENLSQHTIECAFLVHFLSNIGNVYFGKNYEPDKLAAYALFHDVSEILTGDLPTPIKYFNDDIRTAYKQIEVTASNKMLDFLPDELKQVYSPYLLESEISVDEKKILKIADKLSAYIKCIMEINSGNKEFSIAYTTIRKDIESIYSEELTYFLKNCLCFFSLSLDDLKGAL